MATIRGSTNQMQQMQITKKAENAKMVNAEKNQR